MDFYYFLLIGGPLIIYFLLWRLYLLIAQRFISENVPNFVRKPKFWQFFLMVFAIGTARKKLDI